MNGPATRNGAVLVAFRRLLLGATVAVLVADAAAAESDRATVRPPLSVSAAAAPTAHSIPTDASPADAASADAASPETSQPPILGYAFAKASPLLVYDQPAETFGRAADFEFGTAYEVVAESQDFVKIRRGDAPGRFVRRSQIFYSPSPSWVVGSDLFKQRNRPRIRLWENSSDLNNTLSGMDVPDSRYDFEEIFQQAPAFTPRWPVFSLDTMDVIGGSRQVPVAGIFLPISAEVRARFESSQKGAAKGLEVYLLADASGSTAGYLEPAVSALVKAIGNDAPLRARLTNVLVGTFGLNVAAGATSLDTTQLEDIASRDWRVGLSDGPTEGDIEPLAAGLRKAEDRPRDSSMDLALIVLSGADVDATGLEDIDLSATADSLAVFAAITPEPSDSLENASKSIPGFPATDYIDYSTALGEEVARLLSQAAKVNTKVAVDAAALAPMIDAAHEQSMMAFVPRDLTTDSVLPGPQPYAAKADWYTVPLWVVLDGLVLKHASQ